MQTSLDRSGYVVTGVFLFCVGYALFSLVKLARNLTLEDFKRWAELAPEPPRQKPRWTLRRMMIAVALCAIVFAALRFILSQLTSRDGISMRW